MSDAKEQETDAQRLRRFLDQLKGSKGITQVQFASKHKILGGASMISQHLAGNRPINLEQAVRYAAGFRAEGIDCSLGLLSPRLAAEVNAAHSMGRGSAEPELEGFLVREDSKVSPIPRKPAVARWPFLEVTLEQVESLNSDQRHIIESLIKQLLSGNSEKAKHRSPAKTTARR